MASVKVWKYFLTYMWKASQGLEPAQKPTAQRSFACGEEARGRAAAPSSGTTLALVETAYLLGFEAVPTEPDVRDFLR